MNPTDLMLNLGDNVTCGRNNERQVHERCRPGRPAPSISTPMALNDSATVHLHQAGDSLPPTARRPFLLVLLCVMALCACGGGTEGLVPSAGATQSRASSSATATTPQVEIDYCTVTAEEVSVSLGLQHLGPAVNLPPSENLPEARCSWKLPDGTALAMDPRCAENSSSYFLSVHFYNLRTDDSRWSALESINPANSTPASLVEAAANHYREAEETIAVGNPDLVIELPSLGAGAVARPNGLFVSTSGHEYFDLGIAGSRCLPLSERLSQLAEDIIEVGLPG